MHVRFANAGKKIVLMISEPKGAAHLRAVNLFVTAGRPAGPPLQKTGVIYVCDKNLAGDGLLLEVTLQTEGLVSFVQHALIDRSVRRMADNASLTQRLVLEDKRTPLVGVTLETGFVLTQQRGTATHNRLHAARFATFDRASLVRVMATGTTHLSLEHRMVIRQLESRTHFQVALEAGVWRFARVHDGVCPTAACDMKTARPVTRFAAGVLGVLAGGF